MTFADEVERTLPFLRRYARAIKGNAGDGDKAIEKALLELLEIGTTIGALRRMLYSKVDYYLCEDTASSGTLAQREKLAAQGRVRRALMLTEMEGFSTYETSEIMRISGSEVDALIEQAHEEYNNTPSCKVLIIEDEPLIAASLRGIISSLGHTVAGIAATKGAAIALGNKVKPDLILSDVKLADGSLGSEAVEELLNCNNVPVIFITAYPERLLTGQGNEPTYLITKPFRQKVVVAVIMQALFVWSMLQRK